MAELETAFCCDCLKYTTWTKLRTRWRCEGCRTVYPCGHQCLHADCMEERGEVKPDKNGHLSIDRRKPKKEVATEAPPAPDSP